MCSVVEKLDCVMDVDMALTTSKLTSHPEVESGLLVPALRNPCQYYILAKDITNEKNLHRTCILMPRLT